MEAFVLVFLFTMSSSASICLFVSKFSAGFKLSYAIPAVAVSMSVLLMCVIGYAQRLCTLIQRGRESAFCRQLGKDTCAVMQRITTAKTTDQSVRYGIASSAVAVTSLCAIFAGYEDLAAVAEEICGSAVTAFVELVFIDFRFHGDLICICIFLIGILRVRQGLVLRQEVEIWAAILTFRSNAIDHVKFCARTITTALLERLRRGGA